MPHLTPVESAVLILVLIAAATDIRSRRIPNWLTLTGVIAGVAIRSALYGLPGLKDSLEGLVLAFACYFVLYAIRAMGAGDVKLMAAIGAFVGPAAWLTIFVASAIAGGVMALVLIAIKKRVRATFWNVYFLLDELIHFRAPFRRSNQLDVKSSAALNLPHGVAIAAGSVVAFLL